MAKDETSLKNKSDDIEVFPQNPLYRNIFIYSYCISFAFLSLSFASLYFQKSTKSLNIVASILRSLVLLVPKTIVIYLICIGVFFLLVGSAVWFWKGRSVRYDHWLKDIAKKRLSTETIWYSKTQLFLSYDIGMNYKDITDFTREISDKSHYFTYYLQNVDIDQAVVVIASVKKNPLPTKAVIDLVSDTAWNIIPLGEVVDDKRKKISTIGWYLNDENDHETMFETEPSVSLLISGGTGSGKSVSENCVLGHMSRYEDHFQSFLLDIKKVEFGPLKNLASVKKVGLEMDEINDIMENVQTLMMDRFRSMEAAGVNHISKVRGTEVDYYRVMGKDVQFDELFNVKVNGKEKVLTAAAIYEAFNSEPVIEEESDDFAFTKRRFR